MTLSLKTRLGVSAVTALLAACGGSASGKARTAADTTEENRVSTTNTTSAAANTEPRQGVNLSEEIRAKCGIGSTDQSPKFDFDRSDLNENDRGLLDAVAKCLTEGPLKGESVRLVGRADPRGEEEYNMSLGSERATSVQSYLGNLGVERGRMMSTSRGKLDATGEDEAGWKRDRRVDIDLARP